MSGKTVISFITMAINVQLCDFFLCYLAEMTISTLENREKKKQKIQKPKSHDVFNMKT